MYLLKTNTVFELRKAMPRKAHPNVKNWFDLIDGSEAFISVITLQELEIGTLLMERKDASQGKILRTWVEEYVKPIFKNNTLTVTEDVAITSARHYIPNPKPTRDALIAATAEVFKLKIVTRNVADFEYSSAKILNP
jgi:predicted nucleic acid-binding protein